MSAARWTTAAALAFCLAVPALGADLDAIRARGYVSCGVPAESVPGFSALDGAGRARGFDVDFCRALAAAIFANADKYRTSSIATAREFLQSPEIDIVFHGLTWNFTRELTSGIVFGPVTFYDGQAFLAR